MERRRKMDEHGLGTSGFCKCPKCDVVLVRKASLENKWEGIDLILAS